MFKVNKSFQVKVRDHKIGLKIHTQLYVVYKGKTGILHDDKGVNSPRKHNNPRYVCT